MLDPSDCVKRKLRRISLEKYLLLNSCHVMVGFNVF